MDHVVDTPAIFETISEDRRRIVVWELLPRPAVRRTAHAVTVAHQPRILAVYAGFGGPCLEHGDPLTKRTDDD